MGVWLLLFEKKRLCGAIALTVGVSSFLITTQMILPFFSGGEAAAVARYRYLGNSVIEIARNLILKPGLVLGQVFSPSTINYLIALIVPVIWWISHRGLIPLIGAVPSLALNILVDYPAQRELTNQYSLPIVPFLLLAVISTLAAGRGWLRSGPLIILWSLVAFLQMAHYSDFQSYLETLDTWQATRKAIAQIQPQGGVLTDNQYAPHLTHRPVVKLLRFDLPSPADLAKVDYVLLNLRHPWPDSQASAAQLAQQLKKTHQFELSYHMDDVYLFVKPNRPDKSSFYPAPRLGV